MAEFIVQDINLLISKTPEATFNAAKIAGTDFLRAVMRGNTFGFPVLNKVDSSDLVGTGFDFPQVPLRVDYWNHPVMTIGEDVEADLFPIFLARAFGGTNAAPATLNVEGRQHTLLLGGPTQRQLPSSNLITSVGYVDDANPGADFLWMGVVPESVQIAQDAGRTPTWSIELVGSGKFTNPLPAGVRTGLPADVGDDTTTSREQLYVHPASIVISYTDGTTVNLATEGKIRSWNFQFNNNLRRDDRRPGDPFRVANDPTSGAFVNRLQRGRRTCAAQVTVSLTEDLEEYITMAQNRVVDNLAFIMKGNLIPDAVPATNYTVAINIPKAQLRTVSPTTVGDDTALVLDWFPLKGSALEYVSADIINTRTTAYA
jgi:hypothetical protein